MSNIKYLKKQLRKIKAAKKGIDKPYYLFYAAEYGKIKNIGIKLTDKDTYKELQKDTEDFLKWQRYILSYEAEKEAVEGNESIFTVMAANTVHFLGFDDLED